MSRRRTIGQSAPPPGYDDRWQRFMANLPTALPSWPDAGGPPGDGKLCSCCFRADFRHEDCAWLCNTCHPPVPVRA